MGRAVCAECVSAGPVADKLFHCGHGRSVSSTGLKVPCYRALRCPDHINVCIAITWIVRAVCRVE
uniref:Uncharacterized protein n=1 Tax=Anguilla anguilla TaxID=7936 RepID=A0A0E9WHX4_ANGAN